LETPRNCGAFFVSGATLKNFIISFQIVEMKFGMGELITEPTYRGNVTVTCPT